MKGRPLKPPFPYEVRDNMIKVINRSLRIPIEDKVIGYIGDNLVEKRLFELDKFYNNIDLSEFEFKLDTQINGTKDIVDLDKIVREDKIILVWTIFKSHMTKPGHMSIQIRAFKDDVEKWHSSLDYVVVQESINSPEFYPSPLPSEFEQMEQRVTAMRNEANAAAQMATDQANRAQNIADTFAVAEEGRVNAEHLRQLNEAERQAVILQFKDWYNNSNLTGRLPFLIDGGDFGDVIEGSLYDGGDF